MIKNLTKRSNSFLLRELVISSNYGSGKNWREKYGYYCKVYKECLRRMTCYQYAIKPLNKKLYSKLIIKT